MVEVVDLPREHDQILHILRRDLMHFLVRQAETQHDLDDRADIDSADADIDDLFNAPRQIVTLIVVFAKRDKRARNAIILRTGVKRDIAELVEAQRFKKAHRVIGRGLKVIQHIHLRALRQAEDLVQALRGRHLSQLHSAFYHHKSNFL